VSPGFSTKRVVGLTAGLILGLALGNPAVAEPLPAVEAAAWLQKISDASRRMAYEGLFVFQHGSGAQTLSVANRPAGEGAETRLVTLDGQQREVRCSQNSSVTLMLKGTELRAEKRLNKRHFPDLLPEQAAALANWYNVKVTDTDRVAGRDCSTVDIVPKDLFRWGYQLCVDRQTGFPLRAIMVDGNGRPMMQYMFAELHLGAQPKALDKVTTVKAPAAPAESAKPLASERVVLSALPPGFTRIAAVRRQLPKLSGEVEHWVYSDGLTHVSLFLEPAAKPVETLKGQSRQGMINMIKRQVGAYQATVLGEAPWATVEFISANLSQKP